MLNKDKSMYRHLKFEEMVSHGLIKPKGFSLLGMHFEASSQSHLDEMTKPAGEPKKAEARVKPFSQSQLFSFLLGA